MHELGVLLDFKESTIHIDNILLPMRDIANLQLKFSITRALQNNTNHAQAPVITHSTTKGVVEILDAKYEISDIPPAIGREDCSHLSATERRSGGVQWFLPWTRSGGSKKGRMLQSNFN